MCYYVLSYMKTFILSIILVTLLGASTSNHANKSKDIQSYRKQYSLAAQELINNTNDFNRLSLSNKVEQLKQSNLYLFNQ